MYKYSLFIIISFFSFFASAQNQVPDTLLIDTFSYPDLQKVYVIGEKTEMIVNYNSFRNDTTYHNDWSQRTRDVYEARLREYRIKQKPVNKLEADEVFMYFDLGISQNELLEKLGNKKVYVHFDEIQTTFYNQREKKNEVFTFWFRDGGLAGVSRPGLKATLPTTDLQTAFQIVHERNEIKKSLGL